MTSIDHKKDVLLYLFNRNVPTDLALEIRDHMVSQIDDEMQMGLDFDTAFNKVKLSWREDLQIQRSIFPLRRVTKIHQLIWRKAERVFFKNSLYYFLPFFVFMNYLNYHWADLGKMLMLIIFSGIVVYSTFLWISNFKLIRSMGVDFRTNISVYQRGGIFFNFGVAYILFNNLFLFSSRYDKYLNSLQNIVNGQLNLKYISNIGLEFLFIWVWFYGLTHVLKYKNVVTEIQKKITIKW